MRRHGRHERQPKPATTRNEPPTRGLTYIADLSVVVQDDGLGRETCFFAEFNALHVCVPWKSRQDRRRPDFLK